MKRIKIGFICQPFDNGGPPDPGGSIGLLTWELARRLSRSYQVTVCAPRSPRQPAQEQWEGVQFNRVRLRPDYWLLDRPRRLHGPVGDRRDINSILYYSIYAARAARRLHLEKCDIIHIHNFSHFVPIARAFNRKAKIILHMHADWLLQFERNLIAKRIALADAIIGVSEYVTAGIRRVFPEFAHRCFTVFNGCDVDRIKPQPEKDDSRLPSRIVFVGRLSPEKGLHVLIDGFERVVKCRPDVFLEIIGPEAMVPQGFLVGLSSDPMVLGLKRFYNGRSYLESLRGRLKDKLPGKVLFLGYLSREELIERLRQADLFVQPSIASEMFGMAVADAMAAALPVVATWICGLPEVVADGATGLLVPPDNPDALAEAILHVLNDPQLSYAMGQAGRSRVERMFSWDVVVETLGAIYNGLLSGAPVTTLSGSCGNSV